MSEEDVEPLLVEPKTKYPPEEEQGPARFAPHKRASHFLILHALLIFLYTLFTIIVITRLRNTSSCSHGRHPPNRTGLSTRALKHCHRTAEGSKHPLQTTQIHQPDRQQSVHRPSEPAGRRRMGDTARQHESSRVVEGTRSGRPAFGRAAGGGRSSGMAGRCARAALRGK